MSKLFVLCLLMLITIASSRRIPRDATYCTKVSESNKLRPVNVVNYCLYTPGGAPSQSQTHPNIACLSKRVKAYRLGSC